MSLNIIFSEPVCLAQSRVSIAPSLYFLGTDVLLLLGDVESLFEHEKPIMIGATDPHILDQFHLPINSKASTASLLCGFSALWVIKLSLV